MKHNLESASLSLSLYSIVNSAQARAGTMLGGKGRLSPLSVGRIDGPCLVCYNHSGTAESCGRQLIPIPLQGAPLLALLALYTTTEHNDLDHIVVKCFKRLRVLP